MAQTSLSQVVGFPTVPEFMTDGAQHRRLIARQLQRLNQAKFNCAVDVTLNASTGATVLNDTRIGYSSAITPMMGLTPAGAVAIAAGIWCDGAHAAFGSTSGSITIHHAISSATDQKIRFGIFG